jgi:hypothetical protein
MRLLQQQAAHRSRRQHLQTRPRVKQQRRIHREMPTAQQQQIRLQRHQIREWPQEPH